MLTCTQPLSQQTSARLGVGGTPAAAGSPGPSRLQAPTLPPFLPLRDLSLVEIKDPSDLNNPLLIVESLEGAGSHKIEI